MGKEDVVGAAPTGNAPTTSERSTSSLSTKVRLTLEVWRHITGNIAVYVISNPFVLYTPSGHETQQERHNYVKTTSRRRFDAIMMLLLLRYVSQVLPWQWWGGWGSEVSCGGHHRQRGKTTMGSALDGAALDCTQILAYLVTQYEQIPIMLQLYLGLAILADSLLFSVNNILAGLWLNCISSVEITFFLLADILMQQRALFQC